MKLIISLCFIFFSLTATLAQQYKLGMNFDDDAYKKVEKKAQLMTRDYTIMPKSYSLKKYSPTPGNQGQTGTCVGWSSTYAGRTILEAKANGWTDKAVIGQNIFSPGYVYKLISTDPTCQNGTFINDAMETLQEKGAPKLKDMPTTCVASIPSNVHSLASNYKIKGFARLFENDATNAQIIQSTKKSIANGNPVIIGMKCADSFFGAKGAWQPTEDPTLNYGGHAMCVIGYDDDKYGGAFEVQNSWGTSWGNEGYIWMPYDTYADFTKYGYEMIAFPSPKPNTVDLSGEIRYQLASGETMEAEFVSSKGNLGYYKLKEAYTSGTKFRLYISNNQPAYVYAIGTDETQKIFSIFPHQAGISAALNYESNNVAIPDEKNLIRMDNTVGKDYLCVLYCKDELDIESIKSQLEQLDGSFVNKINTVLKNKLVSSTTSQFSSSEVKFTAESGGKTVLAVIVEIEHN
jgi:hypothetical protein